MSEIRFWGESHFLEQLEEVQVGQIVLAKTSFHYYSLASVHEVIEDVVILSIPEVPTGLFSYNIKALRQNDTTKQLNRANKIHTILEQEKSR